VPQLTQLRRQDVVDVLDLALGDTRGKHPEDPTDDRLGVDIFVLLGSIPGQRRETALCAAPSRACPQGSSLRRTIPE
jgi:hypothetical protein